MTDTESTRRIEIRFVERAGEPTWGDAVPAEIAQLEASLATAFHAFDDIDRMSMPHRIRVVNEVTGAVPDVASAAARAGHARWASDVVRAAASRRPDWSTLCSRWDAMIVTSLEAISAVGAAA